MPAETTSSRRRNWGPPRKADHRTGANPDFARAVATALPGVGATPGRGRTHFTAGDARFLTVIDDGEVAVVADPGGGERRLALSRIGRDDVRAAIEEAWRSVATKRQITDHRRAQERRAQEPQVTHDDVRAVVLDLPGATEGPIWGSAIGFLIGTEKKTRFARFGPPVGGGVGNLLPPDDEDTLVILRCPQRAEVLAACPDRFFTTAHYGAPGEPGGVITRLSENRGGAELQELAELLEDAWREVASPALIAERDRRRARH